MRDLDPGARTGTFTLAAGAATVVDTSVTASTVMVASLVTATNNGTLTFTYNTGVSVTIASSDGIDASVYRFALIG